MTDTLAPADPAVPVQLPPVLPEAGAFIEGFRKWVVDAFDVPKPDNFTFPAVGFQ